MASIRQVAGNPESTQHPTGTESSSDSQNLSSDSSRTKPRKTESVPIIKSKFWFSNGNVVIQAENTQFRVHSFMLCRHSDDLRGKIESAQRLSKTIKERWVDDCPLIYLDDVRASDFEHLMSIFYDNIKNFPMTSEMPLSQCAAIIRLGKKYGINYLVEKGLRRFYTQFPCDIAGWDKLCEVDHSPKLGIQRAVRHRDDSDSDFYEQAMALAHEFSLMRALPAICMSLITQKDSSAILRSLDRSRSPNEKNKLLFPPHLLKRCLAGRDKILCELHYWIFARGESPIPAADCESSFGCTPNRVEVIRALDLGELQDPVPVEYIGEGFSHIDIMLMEDLMDPSGPFMRRMKKLQLCGQCLVSVKSDVEKFRSDLWKRLPSIFELGKTWDDLKDF